MPAKQAQTGQGDVTGYMRDVVVWDAAQALRDIDTYVREANRLLGGIKSPEIRLPTAQTAGSSSAQTPADTAASARAAAEASRYQALAVSQMASVQAEISAATDAAAEDDLNMQTQINEKYAERLTIAQQIADTARTQGRMPQIEDFLSETSKRIHAIKPGESVPVELGQHWQTYADEVAAAEKEISRAVSDNNRAIRREMTERRRMISADISDNAFLSGQKVAEALGFDPDEDRIRLTSLGRELADLEIKANRMTEAGQQNTTAFAENAARITEVNGAMGAIQSKYAGVPGMMRGLGATMAGTAAQAAIMTPAVMLAVGAVSMIGDMAIQAGEKMINGLVTPMKEAAGLQLQIGGNVNSAGGPLAYASQFGSQNSPKLQGIAAEAQAAQERNRLTQEYVTLLKSAGGETYNLELNAKAISEALTDGADPVERIGDRFTFVRSEWDKFLARLTPEQLTVALDAFNGAVEDGVPQYRAAGAAIDAVGEATARSFGQENVEKINSITEAMRILEEQAAQTAAGSIGNQLRINSDNRRFQFGFDMRADRANEALDAMSRGVGLTQQQEAALRQVGGVETSRLAALGSTVAMYRSQLAAMDEAAQKAEYLNQLADIDAQIAELRAGPQLNATQAALQAQLNGYDELEEKLQRQLKGIQDEISARQKARAEAQRARDEARADADAQAKINASRVRGPNEDAVMFSARQAEAAEEERRRLEDKAADAALRAMEGDEANAQRAIQQQLDELAAKRESVQGQLQAETEYQARMDQITQLEKQREEVVLNQREQNKRNLLSRLLRSAEESANEELEISRGYLGLQIADLQEALDIQIQAAGMAGKSMGEVQGINYWNEFIRNGPNRISQWLAAQAGAQLGLQDDYGTRNPYQWTAPSSESGSGGSGGNSLKMAHGAQRVISGETYIPELGWTIGENGDELLASVPMSKVRSGGGGSPVIVQQQNKYVLQLRGGAEIELALAIGSAQNEAWRDDRVH